MKKIPNDTNSPSIKGAVFGDIIGAPYIIENTRNRYFDIGEPNVVVANSRMRKCFAECTEASFSALAVSRWLQGGYDNLSVESLRRELRDVYQRHPRASWSEATRLFLSSPQSAPSQTSDWMAVARAVPVATYVRDDLQACMDIAEMAVRATCENEEAIRTARMLANAAYHCQTPNGSTSLRTMLEMQYGLELSRSEEDLRSELRGSRKTPLVIMGQPVEGGYWYPEPEPNATAPCSVVAEAALRAVVNSDSWEDAVRRAVSLGGPSNAVASIAGGVAEAVYKEVTPSLEGKLYSRLPIDIAHHFTELERYSVLQQGIASVDMDRRTSDAVTIIGLGPGNTVFVVPDDRKDILEAVKKHAPNSYTVSPEGVEGVLSAFDKTYEGTCAYGKVPEVRTLYLQDGRLVSPSQYIAPGMPSLQERRKHLEEFLKLRAWCCDCQQRMNTLAGNEGAGQIHYANAYHLWIGSRRIDVKFGDLSAGSISLDSRGLLRVEMGEMRSVSVDARFENHAQQAWASREVFTRWDTISPLTHLQDIRSELAFTLLDEGMGHDLHEIDSRHLSDEERCERQGISNVSHLEPLDGNQQQGLPANRVLGEVNAEIDVESSARPQEVKRVYTLGYGTRTQEGFINTLKMSGIDTVVDIRTYPRSKFAPQFNEEAIYEALEAEGITYLSAGEKLGARPADLKMYSDGVADWTKMTGSEQYRNGIEAIESLSDEGHLVAIVCSEGDPLTCHRFGTVARSLSEDGMDVQHILYNGECLSQSDLEDKLLQKYVRQNKIPSVANGSYSKQLEEAFQVMNDEYGHKQSNRKSINNHYKHKR